MSMNRFMQAQQMFVGQQQHVQNHQYQQQQDHQIQEHHDTEHMASLHARLHLEADKIRKWKIQTEFDMKEKDKKLSDAHSHIEKMKKSLLELQMVNESTKGKLQEEISNREEVLRRVDATRKMCNLLQLHAAKMEEQLNRCEKEKGDLANHSCECSKQIESLRGQFESLEIIDKENVRTLKQKAIDDKNQYLQLEKALKLEVTEKETEIEKLTELLESKNAKIQELQSLIYKSKSDCDSFAFARDELEKTVATLKSDLENKEEELKEASLRIVSLQESLKKSESTGENLNAELNSIQAEYKKFSIEKNETTASLEERLHTVIDEAKDIRAQLEATQRRLAQCECQLKDVTSQLEKTQNDRDLLRIEKTELELDLHSKAFQLENIEDSKAVIEALEDEKTEYLEKIKCLEMELSKGKDQLLSIESSLSEAVRKCKNLQETLESHEEIIAQQSEELIANANAIEELKATLTQVKRDLEKTNEALQQKIQEAQTLTQEVKVKEDQLDACNKEIEALRSTSADQVATIKGLKSEIDQMSEQNKLTGKSLTAQQKKVNEKLKQNKGLEKQVKDLTSRLNEQHEICEQQHNELVELKKENKSLETLKWKLEEAQRAMEEEMKELKENCLKDHEAAKAAMDKALELQASAQKEKEATLARSDCQLQEMMATLDDYRQNNERQILDKDKELLTIRSQLEKSEVTVQNYEKDLRDCKKEMDGLKQQVSSIENEKEMLQRQLQEKAGENNEMKGKISQLEQQMDSLELHSKAACVPSNVDSGKTSRNTQMAEDKRMTYSSTPVVPVTPRRHQNVYQQTPKTPETTCPHTPKTTPVTPYIQQQAPKTPRTPKVMTSFDLKTPQTGRSSILKSCTSVTKRRKVAFHSESSNGNVSSSEESDLMELDPEVLNRDYPTTPLLLRTPCYTPGPRSLNRSHKTPSMTFSEQPTLPTQRNTPRVPRLTSPDEKGDNRGQQSYPKTPNQTGSSTQKSDVGRTPNVRKAPTKASSKIFNGFRGRSPASKSKAKEKSGTDTQELSWFEVDSVFGFGPED